MLSKAKKKMLFLDEISLDLYDSGVDINIKETSAWYEKTKTFKGNGLIIMTLTMKNSSSSYKSFRESLLKFYYKLDRLNIVYKKTDLNQKVILTFNKNASKNGIPDYLITSY